MTREAPPGERVLLVGGVRYDAAPPPPPGASPGLAGRGPARDGRDPLRWRFLDGSQAEVHAVAAMYPRPDRVSLLEGASASEAALRATLPGCGYVHLATHGFFADARFRSALHRDADREQSALGGLAMLDDHATVLGRNPLILSGMVLAGANLPPKRDEWGAPQDDDGILTAEEVAALDLSGTELVVLSACETGRGEVAGGEGVFGLQRAFGLAGARAVIASLWQVDDEATRQLMTSFYESLWRRGMGPLEALRQSQLHILRHGIGPTGRRGLEPVEPAPGRPSTTRTHPRLWAAWMLSGDPGGVKP
jgi:CHAT domain-containing protein